MPVEFIPGNEITLLETGTDYFPALIRALDGAVREIHLETYLFADDDTGQAVADALCRAAAREVEVRVLVDGFGGGDFPAVMMPRLLAHGVKTLIYRPEIARLSFRRHRLRRLHRKLVVVDAQVAFVGGINVIDDNHTPGHKPPRYDYAVRIRGPVLADIYRTASQLWELVSWANMQRRFRMQVPMIPDVSPRGNVDAALVVRDNLRYRRAIEDAYLEAIATARHEIVIANAYFLPGIRFRHALIEAAGRGVNVVILLQGRVEFRLLHWATRALYGHLLGSGVRILEYHRSFMHAKVAVVDSTWATIGSSNIDPFSLMLAREANIVVRNQPFSARLQHSLSRAMQTGAIEIHAEHWKHKPLHERMLAWGAYTLVRLAIGLAGYGRHQEPPGRA